MATEYTAITFSPIQEFIEKSRKLRDLYGSSFILSYLSNHICKQAELAGFKVVSPAMIGVAQGTPNLIIIKGDFSDCAEKVFDRAWGNIVDRSRIWIEKNVKQENGQPYEYLAWKRCWDAWKNHAWEFFCVVDQVERVSEIIIILNEIKRSRNWIGINWTGESSTLSGMDGIAWYGMGAGAPRDRDLAADQRAIELFYQQLSIHLGISIVSPQEQLCIPELIKRLITLNRVVKDNLNEERLEINKLELPKSYKDLNRHLDDVFDKQVTNDNSEIFTEIDREGDRDYEKNKGRYSGWFLGDGDNAGKYLRNLPEQKINGFSKAMRQWGEDLNSQLPKSYQECNLIAKDGQEIQQTLNLADGRIIYAGGDDFLGVLYRNHPNPELTGRNCLNWFYQFPKIWQQHKQKITVSIGFVWAASGVPQRDILQHCRQTESLAKNNGRDRLAIRILFNSGNHLDWYCPWWFLNVLDKYCDRNNMTGEDANWTHIYNDVAILESRHAFKNSKDIALELFEIYFGIEQRQKLEDSAYLWNNREITPIKTGILGEQARYSSEAAKDSAITNWIINLAKVGFHLCQQLQKHKIES